MASENLNPASAQIHNITPAANQIDSPGKLKLKIVDMQAVLIAANPAPCNIHCTFFLFMYI